MSVTDNTSETTTVVAPVGVSEPATTAHAGTSAGSATSGSTTESMPKSRQRSRLPGLLFTIVLLVAVAGLGYGYWQQKAILDDLSAAHNNLVSQIANSSGQFNSLQDSQQQVSDSLRSMQQQLDQALAQQMQNQQQAQQQLQSQLGESNSRIAGLAAQLNAVNGELAAARQRVNQFGTRTADSVMLSEAESLVDLARQRLLVARDVKAATALLIGTDDLLARVASIDVTAARTALASDLTNLRSVPDLDVDALYRQLSDARAQLNEMTVISGTDNPAFAVTDTDASVPPENGWFDNALAALGEYFVVTRQDVEVTPLLTAEQRFLLRRDIELQLASAQLALLNGESDVYSTALAAARDGISRWILGPDESKTALLATLERLQQTAIVQELPDISASLAAIRQVAAIAASMPAAPEDIQ